MKKKPAKDPFRISSKKAAGPEEAPRLISFAPDPLVTLTVTGKIKALNQAAEEASGYRAPELVGRQFAAAGVIDASYLPKVLSEFALIVQGKERPPFEIEIVRKDKSRRLFEVHAQRIQYGRDPEQDILVIFRDIAERKKAERILSESEARYRILAESAHDAIFLIDREERLQYINRFGASWFKVPQEEIKGKTMKELFAESYLIVKENLEIVFQSKKPLLIEEELCFPAGNLWVDVRLIPMLDAGGNVQQITGISRDVTQRKNAEAQTHLQSKALDATSNGIMIADLKGNILWVNPAFSRMTGYSLEEIRGKNPRILKSGEQSVKVYKELWDTILSGNAWAGEMINRRKDGTLYFEKQTVTPVKDDRGAVTHFIAIKQDISADKKLEAQFRQAQKMEAVGRLAGGVAHDFNNLLTIIIGQSDLLLNHLPPNSPIQDRVSEIRNAGTRAANLTRQLLAFSRKQIFQTKVTNLNEIVRGSDKMIRRLLGEDVELVTLFGQNLKPIKVDPSQIEQVIMNLAVNARDAMPQGGKLVIETSEVKIDAKTASAYPGFVPGDYLQLKIQDTGMGIPLEVKAHIFEPFFTTKEQGKGTGLGLATVYGIIKQSKGFIYADTELDKGTAFLVFFPPSEEALGTEGGSPASQKLPMGSETILVVEDEDLVRGLAIQVLSRQGFRVLEARNGVEALNAAHHYQGPPIQMLFTDMVMQYMGGGELAEKFSAEYPKAKIIFTSGYTDHTPVQKWLDRGGRFLQKPYTHAELLLTVRELLDKK